MGYVIQKLILIRGIPGSGKSTLAEKILNERYSVGDGEYLAGHVEADMYFTSPAGTYTFVGEKIGEAHEWCQSQADYYLNQGFSAIVSNTFTRKFEMQPYFDMAEKYGVEVEIIEATGNYQNVHGVPEHIIENMKKRWETL